MSPVTGATGRGTEPATSTTDCSGTQRQQENWPRLSVEQPSSHPSWRDVGEKGKIKTRGAGMFGEEGSRIWWEAGLKVKGVKETGRTSKEHCRQHTQEPSQ